MQRIKDSLKEIKLKDFAIWIVFFVLFIAFALGNPRFINPNNLINVLRQVSMLGIASIGMTFVILTSGIDLSIGSIVTIVNIACAMLMVGFGISIPLAIIISLVLSIIIGFLNGVMIANIGIPPLIATFAMQTIIEGLAYLLCSGIAINGFDDSFRAIGQGYVGIIPVPIIIMFICFALGSLILNKTYFGRYFYAIGGNEEAAKLSGIKTKKTKWLVYMLSGLFAGIAGIVLLSRSNSGQPLAGKGFEFDVITCVVLGSVSVNGGIGKLSNVLAGVLIIGILNNGMVLMNISAYMQLIVKGLILVAAVSFDCYNNRKIRK